MPKSKLSGIGLAAVLFLSLVCVAASAQVQEAPDVPTGMHANPLVDPSESVEEMADTAEAPEETTAADEEPAEAIDALPGWDSALDGVYGADGQIAPAPIPAQEDDQAGDTPTPTPWESMLDTMKWLLVLVAGFIIMALLFRGIGRRARILPGADLADVLGRVYLTANTSVHFVRSGGRVLAIGVAPNHIALLTEFDADTFDAVPDDSEAKSPTVNVARFMDELKQQQGKLDTSTPVGIDLPTGDDDEIDSLRSDIARLRGMLREEPRRDAGR